MSAPDHEDRTDAAGTPGVVELEAEIERTRRELGETVEALAAKADVKGRVAGGVGDLKDRTTESVRSAGTAVSESVVKGRDAVTDDDGKPLPAVGVVVGAVVLAVVGLVLLRRRRG